MDIKVDRSASDKRIVFLILILVSLSLLSCGLSIALNSTSESATQEVVTLSPAPPQTNTVTPTQTPSLEDVLEGLTLNPEAVRVYSILQGCEDQGDGEIFTFPSACVQESQLSDAFYILDQISNHDLVRLVYDGDQDIPTEFFEDAALEVLKYEDSGDYDGAEPLLTIDPHLFNEQPGVFYFDLDADDLAGAGYSAFLLRVVSQEIGKQYLDVQIYFIVNQATQEPDNNSPEETPESTINPLTPQPTSLPTTGG
ncbi:hypothetical protein KQH50_03260 [bacterium]|nr:hypothetical protein [bacterium]